MLLSFCSPVVLIKFFLIADPFVLPDMVDHLVVSHSKEEAFAPLVVYRIPAYPHLFKCTLYHITGILFMPQILEDKAVHIICIQVYTFIILSLRHVGVRRWFCVIRRSVIKS